MCLDTKWGTTVGINQLKNVKFRVAESKKPINEAKYGEFLHLSDETTLLAEKLVQSLTNDLKKDNEPAPGQLAMRISKTILGAVQGVVKAFGGKQSDLR